MPELRFPEFKEEWKEEEIDKLVSFHKGRNLSKNDLSEDGTPCILYGELYTKYSEVIETVHSKANSNKKLVMSKRNDVLLPSSGETALDISSASVVMVDGVALGGDLNILRPKKDLDGRFLSYSLNSAKKTDLARVAQGNSVVHLYSSEIGKIKMNYPSMQEQKRIADFFSTIDFRIEIQENKIKNLEDQKKGYMQRIFSQELRFKDENREDYPEWEEKRLGEIAKCHDSKRIPISATKREQMVGQYPYYGANGIQGYINDYIFEGEFVLLAEDGGNFDDFATKPIAQFVSGKFWVNNHAHILSTMSNTKFMHYSLVHKDIRAYVNGTSRSKLNQSDMVQIKILQPSIEEQQKIANFLSLFDEKIEIEKKILNTLQEMKRGFLQKMFV